MTQQAGRGEDGDDLWMRSVATIYDGKLEDSKRFAGDLPSTIRAKDSGTLNYAIFPGKPARVAVFPGHYASPAGWLAQREPRRAAVALPGGLRDHPRRGLR